MTTVRLMDIFDATSVLDARTGETLHVEHGAGHRRHARKYATRQPGWRIVRR